MPFTRDEMIRILAALEPYRKSAGLRNAQRLRAFVLLLRYSGMRIGDATQLEVSRLNENKPFFTHRNPVCLSIASCPRRLLKRWTPGHAQASDTFSGRANQRHEVPKENGSADCSASLD